MADRPVQGASPVPDAPVALLALRPDGRVVGANRRAGELLAAAPDTLAGTHVDAWLGAVGRMLFHTQLLPRLRTDGRVDGLTLPMQGADGSPRSLLVHATVGGGADAPIVTLALVPEPASRHTEDELLRVRRAADSAPGMVFEYQVQADGAARFTYASAGALDLLGLAPELLRGDDSALLARVHADDREAFVTARRGAGGAAAVWDQRVRMADGQRCAWVHWHATARPMAEGGVAWRGLATDATRQHAHEQAERERSAERAAAEARQASEAFARVMLDAQPTLLAYWDRDLRLGYANRAWLEWGGFTEQEAVGRTLADLLGADFVAARQALTARIFAGEAIEEEVQRTNRHGRVGHFWVHTLPHRHDGAVIGYFVVGADVTAVVQARQQAEQLARALADAERFTRLVADAIPGRVAYWGRDLVCRFANRHFCDWLGKPRDQVVGGHSTLVLGPALERALAPYIAGALAGQPQEFERDETAPDGTVTARLVYFLPEADGLRADDPQAGGFIVLGTDITRLKRAEGELRRLNQQLAEALDRAEAATRAKSAFLANMSHEIRTPMNAIIGLTYLLSSEVQSPQHRQRLGKIDAACQHLLQIINDVLDLSKIEAGALTLEDVEFDIDTLVARAFDLVGARARAQGLELVMATDGLPQRFRGDPTRLSQALVNLLGNAVKFTHQGWVGLKAEIADRDRFRTLVRFTVTDTGEGVPLDRQASLFVPFEQADASTTRRHGGTGLGLAITRHLARLMGGDAGMSSQPGVGSVFWFTAWLGVAAAAPAGADALVMEGRRALVVDDLAEACASIAGRLKVMGCAVDCCSGGHEAVQRVRDEAQAGRAYDLVLVDWRMQPMDGVQTLLALRATLGAGMPPCILVTAFDVAAMWQQAAAARFDAVLVKPFTASALLDALTRALRPPEASAAEAAPGPGHHAQQVGQRHAGQRVLLAEDNPVNQEVAAQLLRNVGLEVVVVDDGQAAVAQALAPPNGQPFDLVLMDMQMPVMDGLSATREIRRRAGRHLTIVAMTANAFGEDRAACLEAGMNDHLAKPVDPETLYATLLRWLPQPAQQPPGPADTGSGTPRPLAERLAGVPQLDLARALRSVAGSHDALERVLRRFADAYASGCPALADGSATDAQRLACHSLRGACLTVGAVALADRLQGFEAGLSGDAGTAASAALGRELHGQLMALVEAMQKALR